MQEPLYAFVQTWRKSRNVKVGKIPQVYSPPSTCPVSCPWNDGACYGRHGKVGMSWRDYQQTQQNFSTISGERNLQALNIDELASVIEDLAGKRWPAGSIQGLWRLNIAGDLPGDGDDIDTDALMKIVEANRVAGLNGFTYTHYYAKGSRDEPMLAPGNLDIINEALDQAFMINLSCDTWEEVDVLDEETSDEVPIIAVIPSWLSYEARGSKKPMRTPGGAKIVYCQAVTNPDAKCSNCGWCADVDRDFVVGFPAHGGGAKYVDEYIVRQAGGWNAVEDIYGPVPAELRKNLEKRLRSKDTADYARLPRGGHLPNPLRMGCCPLSSANNPIVGPPGVAATWEGPPEGVELNSPEEDRVGNPTEEDYLGAIEGDLESAISLAHKAQRYIAQASNQAIDLDDDNELHNEIEECYDEVRAALEKLKEIRDDISEDEEED